MAAIEAWDFSADAKVYQKPSDEETMLVKKISSCAAQTSPVKLALERAMGQVHFAGAEGQDRVKKVYEEATAMHLRMRKCANVAAAMMWTVALHEPGRDVKDLDALATRASRSFGLTLKDMPASIQKNIMI